MKKLLLATASITALIILIFFLSGFQNKTTTTMIPVMNDDYPAAWKKIDSLIQQGLPESAMKEVEALYQRAKNDNNPPQIVKTVLHLGKFTGQLQEEGQSKAIQLMEKELETSSFPMRPIFESYLGQAYANFLSQNRWRFRDRTSTADPTGDFTTWSPNQILKKSRELILASVANGKTKLVKSKDFSAILTEGKNTEALRPTLYDILAHHAIDFFSNEQNNLTEPAYKFYITEDIAIGDNNDFFEYNPETKDASSAKLRTIQLLQELTAHHFEVKNIPALIDVTLKRIAFVNTNAVLENKPTLYKTSLQKLIDQYPKQEMIALAYHKLAQQYYTEGLSYQEGGSEEDRVAIIKARELCQKAIGLFPKAAETSECRNLLVSIEEKNLNQQLELVNGPNQPILTLISYKNIDQVYFKAIPLTDRLRELLQNSNRKQQIKFYNQQIPVQTWNQSLPNPGDYREHQAELKIQPLPLGQYVLMISTSPDFTMDKEAVALSETFISNLGSWSRGNQENAEVIVYDRNTGHPVAEAEVNFSLQFYNRSSQNNETKTSKSITDQAGRVVAKFGGGTQVTYSIKKGKDELKLNDRLYIRNDRNQRQPYYQTTFFTDRAIYRPGQTVYFKGIVVYKDTDDMPTIRPNEKTEVVFYDANNQIVATKTFTTNEFGTFNGNFTAPSSGLLGRMSIVANKVNGRAAIRVEEYKRPKFEVNFDPVEKAYRLDEMVTLTGNAKAFAGNNVDGATVNYRVTRRARYPYWPSYFRGYYRPYPSVGNNAMEIINGTTETDAEGKFTIEFKAIADATIDPENKPEFSYEVNVDVVDITGETRSGTSTVRVGFVALSVQMGLPVSISRDSLKSIEITTKNLSGSFAAAKGKIEIQGITAPENLLVKRYWKKPDTYILKEGEFKSAFPHYAYKDENEKASWASNGKPIAINFDTEKNKTITLTQSLPVGWYRVRLTTEDRYGTPVELEKYVSVYGLNNNPIIRGEQLFHQLEKAAYEPGEEAVLHFGASYPKQKIFFEVEVDGKMVTQKWLDLDRLKTEKIAIEEKHRGNIFYHYSFAKHFRSQTNSKTIRVPWSNKELTFEYLSYRDKLKPGQEEEWQIKVSGPKKEKLAAEMVATLYDASLDEFTPHGFYYNIYPNSYSRMRWQMQGYRADYSQLYHENWNPERIYSERAYSVWEWFGFAQNYYRAYPMAMQRRTKKTEDGVLLSAAPPAVEMMEEAEASFADGDMLNEVVVNSNNAEPVAPPAGGAPTDESKTDEAPVKVRTNLNETVFFFPDLRTDEEGNVILKFTMNEALTRWKFLGMAHTKDLKFGLTNNTVVTQKELMVVPNAPRFVREGDELYFTAKVNNLTENPLTGEAELKLFDALTMKSVDALFENEGKPTSFSALAGQSAALRWKLKIPYGQATALTHRVIARAGQYADGEESTIPVVTNRMLVTEAKPLPIRGKSKKDFTFEALAKAGQSKSLAHHKMTLEFTSNPAWYAVKALPYLMEYPYNCTEQIFNRFYANSLASSVANSHPKVKRIFDQWKGTEAMNSNLRKNQELKSALLEETPWVLAAASEEEQTKNIGLLFDLNKMANEQAKAIGQLEQRQQSDGSFSWMPGGPTNRYITQNILEGLGHLDKLGVREVASNQKLVKIKRQAIPYLDREFIETYRRLERNVKRNKLKMEDDHLASIQIHYLYMRSFFPEENISKELAEVMKYYYGQADKYWLSRNNYEQGMLALALHRADRAATPAKILASLKERAIKNDEMGMYWKTSFGYYWYQLPIETQSLLIEAFAEVGKDEETVDDLKVWLLKTKQTTHWKTTKATASAVYALLSSGANWLLEDQPVDITIGGKLFDQSKIKKEAGSGYFKTSWKGDEITPAMGKITINNPNANVAWGAMYWQYFEDLDQIKTFEETPLELKKAMFKQVNTDRGPELIPVTEATKLVPGDLLKVRIELRVDRPMEYVHMKDMRASGLEPINVLSQRKYQGGLSYYESTKDVSTNFFFSWLPKGTHVFEYPVRVFHAGNFSNGITTIQCMYAPEFTSHSEGIRISVAAE